MLDLEIVAVKCLDCEQMVWAGDDHPCWLEELGMRAFEAAMWARYQAEVAIEPLRDPMTGVDGYVCDPRREEF